MWLCAHSSGAAVAPSTDVAAVPLPAARLCSSTRWTQTMMHRPWAQILLSVLQPPLLSSPVVLVPSELVFLPFVPPALVASTATVRHRMLWFPPRKLRWAAGSGMRVASSLSAHPAVVETTSSATSAAASAWSVLLASGHAWQLCALHAPPAPRESVLCPPLWFRLKVAARTWRLLLQRPCQTSGRTGECRRGSEGWGCLRREAVVRGEW